MIQRLILGIITVVLAIIIGVTVYTNYGRGKLPFGGVKPTATPTKVPESQLPLTPTQGQPVVREVKLFFVALNDNGRSGKQIGCGDSIIAVNVQVIPTTAPLKAALEALLLVDDQYYGQSGLYNAFYQSDLKLQSVAINKGGVATINLQGTQALSGVCDDPRLISQLRETTLQFPSVQDVQMFINGYPIEQLLPGTGR